MTSQDNARYVTVEVFNDGMTKINSRLDAIDATLKEMKTEMGQMKAEIVALDRRVEINSVKTEGLHHFVGFGFTLMAVVMGIVCVVLTLVQVLREFYRN